MDNDSLTSAFMRLRMRLTRIATGILGDSDAAEDALQDAFCRLWTHRNRISDNREAEALSVTTVHNVCIDALRKHSHAPMVSLDENRNSFDSPDDDAAEAAGRELMFRNVERIINQNLSAQQQAIVRMRDIDGLSFETIADYLNMQPATVRVTLSRARKTIRDIYLKTINDD